MRFASKLKGAIALLTLSMLIAVSGCAGSNDLFSPFKSDTASAGTCSIGGG